MERKDTTLHPPLPPSGREGASSGTGKKPYLPPKLNCWGTLQEITRANGFDGARDGGRGAYRRTRY